MSDDRLMGHSYDGVQEYDNPLPVWWLWTFFITIIFGFHYWVYYEFSGAPDLKQELAQEMDSVRARQKSQPSAGDNEAELAALMASADAKSKGKELYGLKCAVCHGPELQGLIGPNLVDEYWIHGKAKLTDIAGVIRSGVPDKGMPMWEGQIDGSGIQALTVYVKSLEGTKPANPKAPQGEKVSGH